MRGHRVSTARKWTRGCFYCLHHRFAESEAYHCTTVLHAEASSRPPHWACHLTDRLAITSGSWIGTSDAIQLRKTATYCRCLVAMRGS